LDWIYFHLLLLAWHFLPKKKKKKKKRNESKIVMICGRHFPVENGWWNVHIVVDIMEAGKNAFGTR